jgi:hypothetical protein
MSKPEPSYRKMKKEMGEFYLALGAFNANMVARVIQDPGAAGPIKDYIINVACPDHDAQCPPGYMWNHLPPESCMKIPEVNAD